MTQDILLLNPQDPLEKRTNEPMGLASIAAYLIKNGYKERVKILDGAYLADKYGWHESVAAVRKEIDGGEIKVFCSSVQQGNVIVPLGFSLLARLKGLDVVLGGHYATFAHNTLTKYATAIVRGDGEITTKELMDALFGNRDLNGIKGVTFYDKNKGDVVVNPDRESVELDKLPLPAIHLLPKSDDNSMSIVESVGCVDKCSFCSIHKFHDRPDEVGYRMKSPSRIKLEVEQAYEFGAKTINLVGELTLFQRQRALEIGDALDSYHCKWTADSHPRFVLAQREILPELKKKGLAELEIGIESGSQHGLDMYNKQTTVEANEAAIEAALGAGLKIDIDFINFGPYSTMDDLSQNIDLMLRHLAIFSYDKEWPRKVCYGWMPIPGTALYEQAEKDNLIIHKDLMQDYFRFKDLKVAKAFALLQYFKGKYSRPYKQAFDEAKEQVKNLREKSKRAHVGMLEIGAAYMTLWRVSRIPVDVFSIAHEAASDASNGANLIDIYCQKALSLPILKTLVPSEIPVTGISEQEDEVSQSLRDQIDRFAREATWNINAEPLSEFVKITFPKVPKDKNSESAAQSKTN